MPRGKRYREKATEEPNPFSKIPHSLGLLGIVLSFLWLIVCNATEYPLGRRVFKRKG